MVTGALVVLVGHSAPVHADETRGSRIEFLVGLVVSEGWFRDGLIPLPTNSFQFRYRAPRHLYLAAALSLETAIYPRPYPLADVNAVTLCVGGGAGLWHAPHRRIGLFVGGRFEVVQGFNLPVFADTYFEIEHDTGMRVGPSASVTVVVGHVRRMPFVIEAQLARFTYHGMDPRFDWLDGMHAGLYATFSFFPWS